MITGKTAVPAYKALRTGLSYPQGGWGAANGSASESSLRDAHDRLPTVKFALDFANFRLEYGPNSEPLEVSIFDTEWKPVFEDLDRPENLTALPTGTYYIAIGVRQQGQFIESENKYEAATCHCMLRLIVE